MCRGGESLPPHPRRGGVEDSPRGCIAEGKLGESLPHSGRNFERALFRVACKGLSKSPTVLQHLAISLLFLQFLCHDL